MGTSTHRPDCAPTIWLTPPAGGVGEAVGEGEEVGEDVGEGDAGGDCDGVGVAALRALRTEVYAAFAAVLPDLTEVLRGLGLPDADTVPVVRALRSALHGFVSLEASGGFGLPEDVDAWFGTMVDVLVAGVLARQAADPGIRVASVVARGALERRGRRRSDRFVAGPVVEEEHPRQGRSRALRTADAEGVAQRLQRTDAEPLDERQRLGRLAEPAERPRVDERHEHLISVSFPNPWNLCRLSGY